MSLSRRSARHSSTDSVDLRGVTLPVGRRGWLDAASGKPSASPGASPPRECAVHSRSRHSSPSGHTPATSRYGADLTAMGSPIPVDSTTESSEMQIDAVMARFSELRQKSASPPQYLSPAPQPTKLKNFEPDYYDYNSAPAAGRGENSPTRSGGLGNLHPLDTSPYPCSTVYSSALMQALSMSEGAASMSANQTFASAQLSGNSADIKEQRRHGGAVALYEDAMRSKLAKQQWMSLEKARQNLLEEARADRECTFKPSVSPYAASIQRPSTLRPERRMQAEQVRRQQWLAMKKREQIERELEPCTFRPLTLRAVHLEPAIHSAKGEPAIFEELYKDAEERKRFAEVVRPRVVAQVEELMRVGGRESLSPERVTAVVDRLFSKAVVVAPARVNSGGDSASHKPQLAATTEHIIAKQIRSGVRQRDIVANLYTGPAATGDAAAHEELDRRVDEAAGHLAEAERKAERMRQRVVLEQERMYTFLTAKYRALVSHASACSGPHSEDKHYGQHHHQTGRFPRAQGSRRMSITKLARASLDLFTQMEAEELLNVLANCGQESLTERQFMTLVLQETGADPSGSLLLSLPPPTFTTHTASDGGIHFAHPRVSYDFASPMTTAAPPPLLRIKREKSDPAALERAKNRREERMAQYRADAAQREARASPDWEGDADDVYTFRPAPRRLIPPECRPDVHVPIKGTRAEELRRAHNLARRDGRLVKSDDDASRQSPPSTAPLTRSSSIGPKSKMRAASSSAQHVASSSLSPAALNLSPRKSSMPDGGRFMRSSSDSGARVMYGSRQSLTRSSSSTHAVTRKPGHSRRATAPRTYFSALPVLPEGPSAAAAGAGANTGADAGPAPRAPGNKEPPASTVDRATSCDYVAAEEVDGSPEGVPATTPGNTDERAAENHALGPATRRAQRRVRSAEALVETALLGDAQSLQGLGRELLLKKLREYQRRRK